MGEDKILEALAYGLRTLTQKPLENRLERAGNTPLG